MISEQGGWSPVSASYHKLLAKKLQMNNPTLFLNIGWDINFTYYFQDELIAKDIGPGNILIDEYLKKTRGIITTNMVILQSKY